MTNVRTLLINPPYTASMTYGRFKRVGATSPPLGLAYLASYLEKHGKRVRILDAGRLGLTDHEILEELEAYKPHIVGFFVVTPAINVVRSLSSVIKQSYTDVVIICGGPHFWGLAEETLRDSDFDMICIGEGEETLLDVVNRYESAGRVNFLKELNEIPGIVHKINHQVATNPPRTLIENLDDIPFPARRLLLPLDYYTPTAMTYRRKPNTVIFTSRGCPFCCIFCASHVTRKVRFFSVEYVLSEIDHLVGKYGVRELTILDDVFTLKKPRVFDICDRLRRRNHDLIWCCNVRVDLIDKDTLKAMKDAGCWMIMPGVESGNPGVLRLLRKGITREQVVQASEWARELGLVFRPSYIIGNPGDTEETIDETIDFARSIYSHYPVFSLMTPYPGTQLWNTAQQHGTINVKDFDYYSPSSGSATYVPHGLTADLLRRKQKQAFRRCYLNPRMISRHMRLIRSFEDVRRLSRAFVTLVNL